MPSLLLYLLKSAVCLALLYSFYGLMLRRETFHRFNRLVLLAILAACLALPAVRLTTNRPTAVNYGVQRVAGFFEGNAVPGGDGRLPAETASAADAPHWPQVLGWLYVAGLIYYMGRYACSLLSMVRLLRRGRFAGERDGCRVVVADEVESPFSWMRWVAISEADLAENGRVLLAHEAAHVRLRHSWDMLLANSWCACNGSIPSVGCCAKTCVPSTNTRPTVPPSAAASTRSNTGCCSSGKPSVRA